MQIDLDTAETIKKLEDILVDLRVQLGVYQHEVDTYKQKVEEARKQVVEMLVKRFYDEALIEVNIAPYSNTFTTDKSRHVVHTKIHWQYLNKEVNLTDFGIADLTSPEYNSIEMKVKEVMDAIALLKQHKGKTIKSRSLGRIYPYLV